MYTYISDQRNELSPFSHVRLPVCTRTSLLIVDISIWNFANVFLCKKLAWIIPQNKAIISIEIVWIEIKILLYIFMLEEMHM